MSKEKKDAKPEHRCCGNSKEKTCSNEQKIAELTDTLQRIQAEFDNYRKRVENERSDCAKSSCAEVILKILPILDNFEIALKNSKDKNEFYKGMEMIYSQLYGTLEEMGVQRIISVGTKFDPHFHEALMTEKSDKEDGIVLEELQKGYLLYDKVIRPARVKVCKK